jgi:hypothetical protein
MSYRRNATMTRIRLVTKRRLAKLAKDGRRSQVETLDIALERLEQETKKAGRPEAATSAA